MNNQIRIQQSARTWRWFKLLLCMCMDSREDEVSSGHVQEMNLEGKIYVSSFRSEQHKALCLCIQTQHSAPVSISKEGNIIRNFHNRIMFKWETLIIFMSLTKDFKFGTWFNFKTIAANEITARWRSDFMKTAVCCGGLAWGGDEKCYTVRNLTSTWCEIHLVLSAEIFFILFQSSSQFPSSPLREGLLN